MAGDDIQGANFFNQERIKELVEKIWDKVFADSNRVLFQSKRFGFSGMSKPSPNVHEMLVTLQYFMMSFEFLITNQDVAELDYDQIRMLLNAKSQIVNMERLASALKAKNLEDFNSAVDAIDKQAPF